MFTLIAAWQAIDAAMRARIFSRFSDCSSRENWSSNSCSMCSTADASTPAGATFTATLRAPNGSASNPLCCSSSEISREHRLLRRRQLQHDRHQQPLALDFLRRALLQHAFKQHALVRHVLVDDPQTIFVHREDERIPNLSQRLQRAQRRQRRLFFADLERRSAAVVGNRLDLARAKETAAFASTAIPPSN